MNKTDVLNTLSTAIWSARAACEVAQPALAEYSKAMQQKYEKQPLKTVLGIAERGMKSLMDKYTSVPLEPLYKGIRACQKAAQTKSYKVPAALERKLVSLEDSINTLVMNYQTQPTANA